MAQPSRAAERSCPRCSSSLSEHTSGPEKEPEYEIDFVEGKVRVTHDYHILSDVNVGADDSRVHDRTLANEDVVPNLEGEEGHAFAELLERRTDHGFRRYDAMSTHSDVGEVSTDDRLRLDDILAVQDNVLRATKD